METNAMEKKDGVLGAIRIADEVVSIIAGLAATEIDGIAGMSGGLVGGIAEMLGKKTLAKGIRLISESDDTVSVECNVIAKFGASMLTVAQSVQDGVKASLESVTGLHVSQVNVNISGIAMPRDSKK